jgi:CDP-glucose 4,6-dehydratase
MIDFWQGKRVFGTGMTGFIGSRLTDRLISLGAEVRMFKHHPGSGVGIVGNLEDGRDEWGMELYIQKFQPEIIFHLAAQPIVGMAWENPYSTIETNVRGTYNLYTAFKGIKSIKSIIHVATDKIFGKVEYIQDASPLLGTGHPYNASKLCGDILAQMYAQAYGYPITVVRHANIYGPGDEHWDRIIPGTINCVLQGYPPVLRGNGESTRDYIFVSEIVDAYLKLAELEHEGLLAVNLGGFNHSTMVVIEKILLQMNGSKINIRTEDYLPGELMHQHIDNSNAKELIGWEPKIDLEEGLRLTIPWYVASISKNAEGKNE